MNKIICIMLFASLLLCLISCSGTTADEIKTTENEVNTTVPINAEASDEKSNLRLEVYSKIDFSFSSAEDLVKWIDTVNTKTFSDGFIGDSNDVNTVVSSLTSLISEIREEGKVIYPFYKGKPMELLSKDKINIYPISIYGDRRYELYFNIDDNRYGFSVTFPEEENIEYLNKSINDYYKVKLPTYGRLGNWESIEGYNEVIEKEVIINGEKKNCLLFDYTYESSRMNFVIDSKLITLYFMQVDPISDEDLKIFEDLTFEYYPLPSAKS